MNAKGGSYQHLMIAELKTLLNNHWTLIVLTVYVFFTCGVYFSESFRQTWLQVLDGNLFTTMINLYLPTFLFIAVLLNAAPIFASDKKNGMEELADTCFYGKTFRKKAKIEATIFYTILITAAGFLVTAAVSLASGTPLDLSSEAFQTVNPDISISNGMFYLFCFAMIILGLIAVASAVVLISSRSDDVIVPLASGILIYGVELALYLKPLARILWDINLLKLLRPYTMLSVSLYFDSTLKALVANVIAFVLVSVALFLLTFTAAPEARAKRTLSSPSS